MIELFRKNLLINSLLLLPYAVILRIHTLLYPKISSDIPANSIQESLLTFFDSGLGQSIAALLLIFFQAVYLNRIVITNRLSQEITLLPGLCYIILCSLIPAYSYLSLPLISNTFILLFLEKAFKVYKRPKAASLVFDIGMLIALSAIVYWPSFVFIVTGYIALVVLRSIKWQDRIQFLCGFTLPFGLWWVYDYCYSNTPGEVGQYLSSVSNWKSLLVKQTDHLIYLAIIFVAIFSCLLKYGSLTKKKSIQVQKKIDVLFWILFCSMLALPWASFQASHLLLVCIPVAFCFSQGLISLKSTFNAELVHLTVLVLLFIMHFDVLKPLLTL